MTRARWALTSSTRHPISSCRCATVAHETALGFDVPTLHWSVPDPVDGGAEAFADVFEELTERIERLARALLPPPDILQRPPVPEPLTPRAKDLP